MVALVTGAGRGLGASIARALAAAGHTVAVNDLADPSAVVEAIRTEGGTASGFVADVTESAEVADLVERITAELGPVDVLVANATGPQPVHRLEELTWDAHLAQLRFFVKSPTLLAQAVVPGMKERGRGRIVHIGSDLFERAEPGWSAYAAAKGALLGLTRVWARELGPHGITVNLVAPGWIPVERHAYVAPEEREWYVETVPMGRFGVPADVAAAVVFLASDGAGFITGQRLAVNGGHVIA